MVTLELNRKMKTNLLSGKPNRVVRTAPQVYTFDEINGDLEEAISAALASSTIEVDPIPSIEPEDFEAVYQWFIS